MKKIISLILVVSMCFTLSAPALAVSTEDQAFEKGFFEIDGQQYSPMSRFSTS